ncbi:MAG: hypothetical protein ACI3XD_03125 [Oscillospiraceae bacterium]
MKKRGRKLVVLFLATLFLVGVMPVSAVDMSTEPVQEMSFNEFEYIEEIQNRSKEELMDAGMSAEDAEEILAFDYEAALYERAQLSEEKLTALGYTEKQIQLLKDFAANPDGDYDLAAASATLQGRLTLLTGGSTFRIVKYAWSWSSMPLMSLNEYVGVCWQGVNSSGGIVDMTNSPNTGSATTNRVGAVTYYDVNSGAQSGTYSLSLTYDSINKRLTTNFPMARSVGGSTLWAKSGYITCKIQTDGVAVNYANFQATYGHQVSSGTISISAGGTFGIAFTPASKIDNFVCNAKVYATYLVTQ